MGAFYVISLKHSHKRDRYITFWRPENKGYAWPLSWAGRYTREQIEQSTEYYNNGSDTIAVPCDFIETLAVAPFPKTIDNDAGPVVLNTVDHWRALLHMVIEPPRHKPRPKAIYFGRNAP